MTVGHRKSRGLDDMGRHIQACAEAQNRTRVLRDIGLEKCDLHSITDLDGGALASALARLPARHEISE
jgi:hypothetical protein